tara:strand:+ start:6355 stop:6990 length:636 start_codon:yes stop_codon:yes gene_type:complete
MNRQILIAMETSGVTRRAFQCYVTEHNLQWEVWSCDLLPADDGETKYHVVDDAVQVIDSRQWDFILAHPPCTALAVSGNAWYGRGMPKNNERIKAIRWTTDLWELIKRRSKYAVMENPVGVLPFRPDQYVQPYQFGHPESKKTGLWLYNLPLLKDTNNVKDIFDQLPKNKQQRLHYLPPSKDRWKLRSKTYKGIGEAIANQCGDMVRTANG